MIYRNDNNKKWSRCVETNRNSKRTKTAKVQGSHFWWIFQISCISLLQFWNKNWSHCSQIIYIPIEFCKEKITDVKGVDCWQPETKTLHLCLQKKLPLEIFQLQESNNNWLHFNMIQLDHKAWIRMHEWHRQPSRSTATASTSDTWSRLNSLFTATPSNISLATR